ncbi:hypothetical protein L3Y34_011110 [Caenorhabditis briggsae]|uniref:Uncharacterized protein n=1 Tax=Caenorhabditis briggsae TaxID=6238 RepID=A0AAE9CU22_CAEBR|nr:hypothetical protein L3Y34_011110 [Caenorhabditis briggsae]
MAIDTTTEKLPILIGVRVIISKFATSIRLIRPSLVYPTPIDLITDQTTRFDDYRLQLLPSHAVQSEKDSSIMVGQIWIQQFCYYKQRTNRLLISHCMKSSRSPMTITNYKDDIFADRICREIPRRSRDVTPIFN